MNRCAVHQDVTEIHTDENLNTIQSIKSHLHKTLTNQYKIT